MALLRGVGLVDGHHDDARGGRPEVRVGPLRARAREDPEPLPGRDSEVYEAERDFLDDLAQLGVGDVLPRPFMLEADRGQLPVARGSMRYEVRDRPCLLAFLGLGGWWRGGNLHYSTLLSR